MHRYKKLKNKPVQFPWLSQIRRRSPMLTASNTVGLFHMITRHSCIAAAAFILAMASPAYSHKMTVDKNGCHQADKSTRFHCHEGPLKGRSFADRRAMNAALAAARMGQKQSKSKGKPDKN